MFDPKKVHTEYARNLKYWKMVRDFVEGKDEVRDYLRYINSADTSHENVERNKEYRAGAVYLNVSSRTKNALLGAVFRKDPTIEVPPQIDYIIESADGSGKSIRQISKEITAQNIQIGRHGVLTEFDEETSRAKICQYAAEAIINWTTFESGAIESVTLKDSDDYYRVLKYEDGLYIVEKYEKETLIETLYPTDFNGERWDIIPFSFVGSDSNTADISPITMLDIVQVSKGHLQNSADYEDHLFNLGATFASTVPDDIWMKKMMPNGYNIGPRGYIPLPENGTAMLLQPTPTSAHSEAMKQKEEQMVLIGARLISSGQAAETAEAVKIRYSGENSVLDSIAQNVSEAMEDALEWACRFMGGDADQVEFELNREFFDTTLTPQEIMADIQLLDRGVIAIADLRDKLRKNGKIGEERDDDIIDDEVEIKAGGMGS